VVKVSHHGSADQHPALYRLLEARVALIGVGVDNPYGHPAPGILRVLEESSVVIRSDISGTVTLHKNDAGDIVVWSERSAQHSVAP
jgi:competence protein ComEC